MTGNRLAVGLRAGVIAWRAWVVGALSLGVPAWAVAAEGEGGASIIEINWTLGVQLISFLLLLAVLYKLL